MRRITDLIVLHCSASRPSQDIGAKEIDRWHRAKGFRCIGYHYVIRRNGTIETGRPLMEPGAHVNPPEGINSRSVGICMVGGVKESDGVTPENNFTPKQWEALEHLVSQMEGTFPVAKVVGHGELAKKAGSFRACPSFNVQEWNRRRPYKVIKKPDNNRFTEFQTLKRGSEGSLVMALQGLLITNSHANLKADGIYGPATERAVKAFQKGNGLVPDGIVGEKTWTKLQKV